MCVPSLRVEWRGKNEAYYVFLCRCAGAYVGLVSAMPLGASFATSSFSAIKKSCSLLNIVTGIVIFLVVDLCIVSEWHCYTNKKKSVCCCSCS